MILLIDTHFALLPLMQCVSTFFLIDVIVVRLALIVVAAGSVSIGVVARLVSVVIAGNQC